MNFPLIALAVYTLLTISCGDTNRKQSNSPRHGSGDSAQVHPDSEQQSGNTGKIPPNDAKAAGPFFPVADFLRTEISYVDSLPVGIKKYHIVGKRTDSSYIKIEEFHRLASEFITPELDDSAMQKYYMESSFFDRSDNSATFFYKARDPSTVIQRVDVVTTKGDVYDEVKSIYIEKRDTLTGKTINKRIFWKPKRNFQIVTIGSAAKGKADVVKVVWDNRE